MALDPVQIRFLRGLAHDLNPVVMIGQKGMSDGVRVELDDALSRHELVKIRVISEDRDDRDQIIQALARDTRSELIQKVGHTATFYRRAKKPKILMPGEKPAARNESGGDRPARDGQRPFRPRRDELGGGYGERPQRKHDAADTRFKRRDPEERSAPRRASGFTQRPPRGEASERAAPRRERTFGGRADGPTHRPARDFGDRPARPARDFGDRPARPKRDFGDRPARPARDFGDRPARPARDFGDRPARPKRDFGDRPARPARDFGDRPARPKRDFGDRPARPARDFGDRPARPARDFGDRPARPARDFGDRPARPKRDFGDRPARPARDFGDRPARPARDFGDRPARPARDFGDRPARPARDFGDRPARPARSESSSRSPGKPGNSPYKPLASKRPKREHDED